MPKSNSCCESKIEKLDFNEATVEECKSLWLRVKGVVLGAFYYGYFFIHLYGGQLALWLGARNIVGFSLLSAAILTILTPLSAYIDIIALIVLRIITGILQGVVTPGIYTIFSQWIPFKERSTALAFVDVGANSGTLITMLLSGILCKHGFAGGWPSVFYTFGTVGLFFSLIWWYAIHDTPEHHPRVDSAEIIYIQNNIDAMREARKPKIPWLKIVSSLPVWSIGIAKFCGQMGLMAFKTKLPAYMATVLHLPIDENGTINALIFICLIAGMSVTGFLSDYIERRKLLSKTMSRKLFETISYLIPAIAIAAIPFASKNETIVLMLLMLSMLAYGFHVGGDNPIVVDVAPDFSGSVYGFVAAFGSVPGFLAPLVIGYIIDLNPGNPLMWNYVFYMLAGLYFFGFLVFTAFATSETQSWGTANVLKCNKLCDCNNLCSCNSDV
ncbi:Sialin-like protein [Dinothrombium tinctorium]|uniref:Sialin-like protein n=1 Tax=Dinothrombium tinctorium TaxID=1965070 RepID=A0A443RJF7_9ACAR|nr:Sialin-like protein [Dinothrombium tinctorium]